MNKLIKKQDYLIKSFGFVLLFGFVSLGAIGGCNNNGGQNGTRALTENDFSEDSSLFAEADEEIIVDFLEPSNADKPEMDTGETGIDVIPYTYTETLSNTFCWEDEDLGAEHFMTLVDSEGAEVLMVEANGVCATALIEEGDYEIRIHHDGRSEDSLAIFIVAKDNNELEARNTETNNGIFKTTKGIISETLNNIGIIKEARAQLPGSDIETLLTTGECVDCRLFRANLAGATLSGVNLEGANLFSANLEGANLTGAKLSTTKLGNANLTEADLTEANLTQASLQTTNFSRANLTFANLTRADMTASKLTGANLTGANLNTARLLVANLIEATLTRADLTNANLINADLARARLLNAIVTGADLGNANLVGATWIDGGICQPGSIGMCIL